MSCQDYALPRSGWQGRFHRFGKLLCGLVTSAATILRGALKLKVPFLAVVLLPGQVGDLGGGSFCQRLGCVPSFEQGGFHGGAGQVEIYQEVRVRTVAAIVRLPGGQGQSCFDERQIKVQQKRAVEEEKTLPASLGIAGKFETADGEVGVALHFDLGLEEGGQGGLVAFEDESVGGGDAVERAGGIGAQNQGVVQATWSLQDGPAAGAAAQDGNGIPLAVREVDLGRDPVAVADDDEVLRRLPEAEQFPHKPCFAEVE